MIVVLLLTKLSQSQPCPCDTAACQLKRRKHAPQKATRSSPECACIILTSGFNKIANFGRTASEVCGSWLEKEGETAAGEPPLRLDARVKFIHGPVFALQDCVLGVAYAITGIVAAAITIAKLSNLKSLNLDAIPTVGPSTWLGSLCGGMKRAIEVFQEGYEKYKSAPFKVTDGSRWIVVLGSRQHIEELRKALDDVLSFIDAVDEIMQTEHTVGPELHHNTYHVEVIRSRLTQNLSSLYPEIRDEVSVAFDEVLDLRDNDLGMTDRDPDWLNFSLRHTRDVVMGADVIRPFPGFLAPERSIVMDVGRSSRGYSRALDDPYRSHQLYCNPHELEPSLGKMHKIDTFLKRLVGVGSAGPSFHAFAEGGPANRELIVAPSLCLHLDNKHYDNAHVFDPFRFSNLRDEGEGANRQFASTSPEYLPFGHGKYACPGRFFTAIELKTTLAHVVMSYDVKLDDKKTRKKESLFPDPAAKVMFRRRAF
ncbi:hypothetical protein OG21DRAFT_1524005 [Imleria badia]|nr:hypothetical protein OG21DRAFT_1524005 [Imleria badia]